MERQVQVKNDDSFLALLKSIFFDLFLQSGSLSLSQIIIIVHIRPDPLPCKAVSRKSSSLYPNSNSQSQIKKAGAIKTRQKGKAK
jgi:hypothetical protein